MKNFLGLISFLFLIVFGFAIGVMGLIILYQAKGPLEESQTILIERGEGTRAIAKRLEDNNIIINQYPFLIGSKLKNSGKPIQAGEFEIPAHASMGDVLDILQQGKALQRSITIPEGRTSWQIIQTLKEQEFMEGDITIIPPEGSLMPDTYFYNRRDVRMDQIAHIQEAMNTYLESLQSVFDLKDESYPLKSMEEVLILASIVEKETAQADEYKKVAGVFINRLKKGMKLQTDPTVIYGITMGKHQDKGKGPLGRRLLTKDLQKDTPYNTYTRVGLPPTPICNPGRKAIAAVLNPDDHDYIFFVADGSGGHAFAKTLAEHNRNVANWRKIRR